MNLRYIVIISVIVLVSSNTIFCQTSRVYHAYKIDGSYPIVEKWNVKDTTGLDNLIEETYDSLNRVTRIRFMNKNNVREIFPMYGISIITYEYDNNLIIEKYFDYLGNQLTLFNDESPSYRIYYLDSNNKINRCTSHHYIKVDTVSKEGLKKIQKSINIWLEVLFKEDTDSTYTDTVFCFNCDIDYIYGFKYSYIKIKGVFPKIDGYNFNYNYFKRIYGKDAYDEFIRSY